MENLEVLYGKFNNKKVLLCWNYRCPVWVLRESYVGIVGNKEVIYWLYTSSSLWVVDKMPVNSGKLEVL